MWPFSKRRPSGFSYTATAEQVTQGIDGNGLTAIVTGASHGIGVETTRVLAMRGVHVVMAVRNTDAGRKVKDEIFKEVPTAKVDVMELDLSSLASVRNFASEFVSFGLPLNILINNAGIMATSFKLSKDEIELQFATNHLGHFLLTNLLLDTMKRTAQMSKVEGRIVIVSSEAYRFADKDGIRSDKINKESEYNSRQAYGQSKLANILHAKELASRLKEEGVNMTANALHPGAIATNLAHDRSSEVNGFLDILGRSVMKSVQQGASTTCYLALNPQVKGVSGEYFSDNNVYKLAGQANDMELARKLWDFSINLCT